MKKLLIPFVALLALAACSKVNPMAEESEGQTISFQVAGYAAGTKANESLAKEFTSFHTYGIFHTYDPDAEREVSQWFMGNEDHPEGEEVLATGEYPNVIKWAPVLPYYWPKVGNISFYSYAGTRRPDVWPKPETEIPGNVMFRFGSVAADGETIIIRGIPELAKAEADPTTGADAAAQDGAAEGELLPADNILVADVANDFKVSQNRYRVDELDSPAGVPTLFHHMLAKIRFQVVLDASDSDANTTWTVNIPEQPLVQGILNEGALYVDYPEHVGYAESLDYMNYVAPLTNDGVRWERVIRAENPSYQLVATDGLVLTACQERVPAANVTDDAVLNNLIAVPLVNRVPVGLRECVVIPQDYTDLPFTFNFELISTYTDPASGKKEVIKEKIHIPESPNNPTTMSIFTGGSAGVWERNHIYTYRIIIKPNGELTFDPAVVDWVPEEGEFIY